MMGLKGTPYYDMALDAGASKGDEAEQMAQMIQADHWESQFEDDREGFFCPKCGTVYPENEMRCLTCNPISNQLDMFTNPKAVARETDPETSWEAAVNITGIRDDQAKIWNILIDHGPLIDESIYRFMIAQGWMISESGCRTRRKELTDLGLVQFDETWGETKLCNRSRQWRAVPLAIWRKKEFSRHPQIERVFGVTGVNDE